MKLVILAALIVASLCSSRAANIFWDDGDTTTTTEDGSASSSTSSYPNYGGDAYGGGGGYGSQDQGLDNADDGKKYNEGSDSLDASILKKKSTTEKPTYGDGEYNYGGNGYGGGGGGYGNGNNGDAYGGGGYGKQEQDQALDNADEDKKYKDGSDSFDASILKKKSTTEKSTTDDGEYNYGGNGYGGGYGQGQALDNADEDNKYKDGSDSLDASILKKKSTTEKPTYGDGEYNYGGNGYGNNGGGSGGADVVKVDGGDSNYKNYYKDGTDMDEDKIPPISEGTPVEDLISEDVVNTIMTNVDTSRAIKECSVPKSVQGRNGIIDPRKRWYHIPSDNTWFVAVAMDPSWNSTERNVIFAGLIDIQRKSCMRFRIYSEAALALFDYVFVRRGAVESGCFSVIGRQRNGRQIVNLEPDRRVGGHCIFAGIVSHEFLHAIGFDHEQNTPGRDAFVTILFDNIIPDQRHNFEQDSATEFTGFGTAYDYGSIMHYGKNDFSSNGGDTILVKQAGVEIGQREALSATDGLKVRLMHKCSA